MNDVRRKWMVPLALILMGGCAKPKFNWDDYPKFFPRHETVELKYSQVVQREDGGGYSLTLTPGVLPNGHPAVVASATGGGNQFIATYDRTTREWAVPLFYVAEHRLNYIYRSDNDIIKNKGVTITNLDQYREAEDKFLDAVYLGPSLFRMGNRRNMLGGFLVQG